MTTSSGTRHPSSGTSKRELAEQRAALKNVVLCSACYAHAAPGRKMCDRHLEMHRVYSARREDKIRDERRAKGLCPTGCGRPATGGRCLVCSVRVGDVPPGLDAATMAAREAPAARVKAATVENADGDGRTRYKGQGRRGAPPAATLARQDAQDLRWAARELIKSADAIEALGGVDLATMPRIRRDALKREVLSYADFGVRLVDAVLERHRYGQQATDRLERGTIAKGRAIQRRGERPRFEVDED